MCGGPSRARGSPADWARRARSTIGGDRRRANPRPSRARCSVEPSTTSGSFRFASNVCRVRTLTPVMDRTETTAEWRDPPLRPRGTPRRGYSVASCPPGSAAGRKFGGREAGGLGGTPQGDSSHANPADGGRPGCYYAAEGRGRLKGVSALFQQKKRTKKG